MGKVEAATYYVDNSITDTNVSSATPDFTTYNPSTFSISGGSDSVYKTIADIDAKTFLPGDNIYFRKGQTWSGTITVTYSGTNGNIITWDSFGTGAPPEITSFSADGSGVGMNYGSYTTIQNLNFSNSSGHGITFSNNNASNVTIYNVTTHNCAYSGILFDKATAGYASTITINNVITYGNGTTGHNDRGITASFDGISAIQNTVSHDNIGNGISASADGSAGAVLTIFGSESYSNTAFGFASAGGVVGATTVVDSCSAHNNGGFGIINHSATATNEIVKRCKIYNNSSIGIQIGQAITDQVNSTILNNTIYNNSDYGLFILSIGTHVVKNNIFQNNNPTIPTHTISWLESGETLVSDYNNFYSSTGTTNFIYNRSTSSYYTLAQWKAYASSAYDQHSIGTDSLFANTGANDFRLQPTSPAINAGTNVGLTTDYLGNPIVGNPDMGAYEYQVPSSPTSLAQYKSDGTTSISSGSSSDGTTAVLKFSMSSLNTSDSLTPQVEIQQNGTSLTNTVTNSGTPVAYSGSPVTGVVTVTGLTPGQTYHWQARISNSAGTNSFVTMGGNPDFGIPSNIATVTSSTFTVSALSGNAGTITNVPYNTSKATFEAALTLATGATWNTSSVTDPVVSTNTLVVTAEDGTTTGTYTVTVTVSTPTNLSASSTSNNITLTVDSFPNDTLGQSGYYFSNSTKGTNSGWIQTNSWTDTGLSCGTSYTYSVKYRNGDGVETDSISTSKSTSGCGGGGGSFLINVPRVIAPVIPTLTITPPTVSTPATTAIVGCDNRTTGFSVTTGLSCGGTTTPSLDSLETPLLNQGGEGGGNSVCSFCAPIFNNGSQGESVKDLQRFLNKAFNLNLKIDGILGPKTVAVIKKWQKAHGLVADGLVGKKTKAKMKEVF